MKREVENATEKAKDDKAPGMDGIQNEIIKMFKEEVSLHLTKIFNDIAKKGWVPVEWKIAEIILIFKKGERENIDNCRPIV